ncbi:MAG TPA: FHA domain-containing protein [Polyangiaceae bacterium]|nr:FHA domain-containing protein [Polyangiaceae bacterium]
MGITVIVRAGGPEKARLTFDGTQRVVIGRGPGSDVRLPDTSVSHRHATLRAQGAEFVLVDEGSTNGTFVGDVRIAPNTSRLVRSGDRVRVGRICLEFRVDRNPVTRDLAVATRDLALALVAEAIEAAEADSTIRVRVVEGTDQGSALLLTRVGHEYVIGRAPHCDLQLNDPDVSREHLRVMRKGEAVVVIDTGAKNGTSVGAARVSPRQPAVWRPAQMVQVGRTVLSLEEPLVEALARIEGSPDEPIASAESRASDSSAAADGLRAPVDGSPPGPSSGAAVPLPPAGPDRPPASGSSGEESDSAPAAAAAGPPHAVSGIAAPEGGAGGHAPSRRRWSAADVAVMTAAVGVLAVSLAGLVWLLRG